MYRGLTCRQSVTVIDAMITDMAANPPHINTLLPTLSMRNDCAYKPNQNKIDE